MTLHPSIAMLMPEAILVVAAGLALGLGLSSRAALRQAIPLLALGALGGALFVTMRPVVDVAERVAPLVNDSLTSYVRLVVCLVGVLIVLVNRHVPESNERGEYFSLLLLSLAGISLVAASDDLLLLFLGLELVSIPTYVMIALSRSNEQGQEAACKYFFLGAFAAAITLYGFSFLYGIAGTTSMSAAHGPSLAAVLAQLGSADNLLRIALILSLASLAFKVAAVPFHAYVPDVYQGASASLAGSLGFIPKFAGFVALIRLLGLTGWHFDNATFWILWGVAAATMTVGNTLALMQDRSVKRTLAYSSIAHSGYMLVALLAGPGGDAARLESPFRNGIAALLFYMTLYGVMNLGAFSALAFFRSRKTGAPVDSFDDLSQAARARPWPALALAVCALGLMGLPPTAGLLGKLYVFSSALSMPESSPYARPMLWLVIIGVANAAVGAAYYLRIIAACALGERRDDVPEPTRCTALRVGFVTCALIVLIVFVWPNGLMKAAREAASGVSGPHVEAKADAPVAIR